MIEQLFAYAAHVHSALAVIAQCAVIRADFLVKGVPRPSANCQWARVASVPTNQWLVQQGESQQHDHLGGRR